MVLKECIAQLKLKYVPVETVDMVKIFQGCEQFVGCVIWKKQHYTSLHHHKDGGIYYMDSLNLEMWCCGRHILFPGCDARTVQIPLYS